MTFSPISYDESQVGAHKYTTISEVAGTETGITYDKTGPRVEVNCCESKMQLGGSCFKETNDLVFTNKYLNPKTEVPVEKSMGTVTITKTGERQATITVRIACRWSRDTGKTHD